MLYWEIKGYNGTDEIFSLDVKKGVFSEKAMQSLLQFYAASEGALTREEVAGALAKRRSRIANNLLEVRMDGRNGTISCGENPHFVARAVERDDA